MRRSLQFLALALAAGITGAGLVSPDDPIPEPGVAGAPHRELGPAEQDQFLRGRLLFDKDFGIGAGVGPQFNGDSCRACHHDPVVGGAGGIDLQVQRPAIDDGGGGFTFPPETGPLAQTHSIPGVAREEIPDTVVFVEERNSPTILGLGLVDDISDATILANEDATDANQDGVFGVAHVLPGNVVGKLGWKAQVPDLRAFVRDAMGNELGITVPDTGSTFGFIADADAAADPELPQADLDDIVFFLDLLDFRPRGVATARVLEGESLFQGIGCAQCHIPSLDGVELYSNLLLHDVLPAGFQGVTQGDATSGLYRTPPLRGLRETAPYFHDGRSPTIDAAIRRHDTEALTARQAYEALTPQQREALIAFLESL